MTDIRVQWSVTLWGPRAADNPEHSVGGSGSTPEEALQKLRENLVAKDLLTTAFLTQAKKL